MGAVTLAYSFPIFRIRNTRRRFREVYLVKVSLIGFVWSVSTVLLPALDPPAGTMATTLLFIERWLFVMAITVPFEIRDMEQEERWGNMTLPVALGVKRSKVVALVMLAVYEALLFAHFLLPPGLSAGLAAALALSALPAAWLVHRTNSSLANFYYKFYVDGTMMLQYLFVILMSR